MSLSNLIKSSHVVPLEDMKRLEQIRRIFPKERKISGEGEENKGNPSIDVETQSMRERLLRDAEEAAESIMRSAREAAEQIRAEAEREAERWWESRREEDARLAEEAKRRGYEEGYREGLAQAEAEMRGRREERLAEARRIVEQAYEAKQSLILEAEQFLGELSCGIAEKIVARKLREAPDLALALIADALSRRKEQGVITLCVSPEQFAFVHAAREELAAVVDAQAELRILPDPGVKDGGCLIRSAYGSIDARIDTQLNAIREQLLQLAAHAEEEEEFHAAGS